MWIVSGKWYERIVSHSIGIILCYNNLLSFMGSLMQQLDSINNQNLCIRLTCIFSLPFIKWINQTKVTVIFWNKLYDVIKLHIGITCQSQKNEPYIPLQVYSFRATKKNRKEMEIKFKLKTTTKKGMSNTRIQVVGTNLNQRSD